MLKLIELKNFQPYQDAKIYVDPGVNVFTGQSDAGKSSVVRATGWNLQNVIKGDFHCHQANDNETSVKIYFDDAIVERIRNTTGTKNHYHINEDPKGLTALRTGVPDEVLQVTRMNELNLQRQHDAYFLFNLSGGQIASRVNSIVGLEIMDQVLSTINQIVKETQKDVADSEKEEKRIQSDIDALNWVDQVDAALKEIEEIQAQVSELETHCADVKNAVQQARNLESEIAEYDRFLTIEPFYNELVSEYAKLFELEESYELLSSLLKQVRSLNSEIVAFDNFLSIEPEYQSLVEFNENYVSACEFNSNFRDDITKIRRLRREKDVCDNFLSIESEYEQLLASQRTFEEMEKENLELAALCSKARNIRKEVQKVRKVIRICDPIVTETLLIQEEYNALNDSCDTLRPLIQSVKQLRKQHSNISQQLQDCDEEYHRLLGENDECPMCGQIIQK